MTRLLPERSAAPTFSVTPVLRAIATATPPHRTPQTEVREVARTIFPRLAASRKMLDVFENGQIDQRFFAMPLAWYAEDHSWAEKNAVYVREALRLSVEVAGAALKAAGARPSDVDAVVFVSSTGVSTPSLDSFLIESLGLSPQAARLPLWGLGCAGGASGLARAADLVRAGFQNVLLIAVELCSLTLVRGDESKSNFVGTALFADGAAAVLLGPRGEDGPGGGPRLHGAYSTQIPGSADVMGWDVVDAGLRVRFSRDIPALVRQMMPGNVEQALAAHGWSRDEIEHFVVHPGGAKVVAAYEQALDLPPGALDGARAVLREHGNMSSPTVLFVLERVLRKRPSGKGLLSAMGPGFCAEHVLLEF